MKPLHWRLTGAFAVGVATALIGCATSRPSTEAEAAPAAVELGGLIRVLDIPPTSDTVRAVAARNGSVHVLVASAGARRVTEIVVSPSGALTRRAVLTDASASTVDAAFDRHGRLHAIVDAEHLVCEEDVWRKSARTPWHDADVRPAAARFVPNAPDLVWTFSVSGKEIGASGRWEVYGFGGYGAGVIWPWFTHGTRAVVVADSAGDFGPWIVIDPDGLLDTVATDTTADGEGNVYVAYAAARGGLLASSAQYFVKLDPKLLAGDDGLAWQRPDARTSAQQLRAVKGSPLPGSVVVRGESAYRPNYVPHPPHFFGGTGAFRISTDVSQRTRALVVAEAHDKWLGHDFPLQYVEFNDVNWSAPIEVGLADHAGGVFGGYIWSAYDIATTGDGRTFVAWPTAQGIVGRWIVPRR